MASDNRAEVRRQTKSKKKAVVNPQDVLPPDGNMPPPPMSHADSSAPQNGEAGHQVQDEITDAVIIRVVRQENGAVSTAINILGDVRVTEIETLLRIAQKTFLSDGK